MSPRLRILAAAALVGALGFAGMLVLLGGGQGQAPEPKVIKPLHPVKKQRRAATKTPPKRKRAPAIIDGMPAALANALAAHQVVVVALYSPNARVDVLAEREARAGAAIAGVGFVRLDVTSERQTRPLTSLLSAAQEIDRQLDSPAVLVFQQPKNLFVRLNGFNDAQTIAQAAENAVPLVIASAANGESAWTDGANAVCAQMGGELEKLAATFLKQPANGTVVFNRMLTIMERAVTRLRGLKTPPSYRAQAQEMVADFAGAIATVRLAVGAARRKNYDQARSLLAKSQRLAEQGNQLAFGLGATRCGAS